MSDVTISCPHCGFSKTVASEKLPGKKVRITCPKCREPFVFDATASGPAPERPAQAAAAPPDTFSISCPSCGYTKDVPAARLPDGPVKVNCPRCKNGFTFARPAGGPGPAAPASGPATPPEPAPAGEDAAPKPAAAPEPKAAAWPADIGGLFSYAWQTLKLRAGTLYGLLLLSYVLPAAALLLFVGASYLLSLALPSARTALVACGGLAGIAASVGASGLVFAALFYAVCNRDLGFRGALGAGRLRMWSFVWAGLLNGFMVLGGLLFFIVPGIVFAVWFVLCFFVLADEEETGMAALMKSREYVRGRWFGVFLRLIVIWVVSLVGAIPVVGILLGFLLAPLVLLYLHGMYLSLRQSRPVEGFAPGTGERLKLAASGAMGYVIVPLLAAAFLFSFSAKHGVSFDQALKEFGLDRTLSGVSVPSFSLGGEDGGELGEVYTAYREALEREDTDAVKGMLAREPASQMKGVGAEIMLGLMKSLEPDNITMVDHEIKGDTGTLFVESDMPGGIMEGKILFVRDDGRWKISKEDWDMTLKPRPVGLSGGKGAPEFKPVPQELLAPYGLGWGLGADAFFNKDDKPRKLATLTGHEEGVSGLAFSPDGSRLVSASYGDFTVRLWDPASSTELDSIKLEYRPVSIALTPNGYGLVVTDAYGGVSFIPVGWDGFGDAERAAADVGHEPRVAVSPGGELLATSSFDKKVTLWNLGEKKELARVVTPEPMRGIAFGPSGSLLAAGSTTHNLTLWDLTTGKGRTYAVSKVDKNSDVASISISPDSKYMVTGHMDSSIVIWDMKTQEELFNFYVTDASTMDVKFSPKGDAFATAHAGNNEIYLWEPSTARKLMTLKGHAGTPVALAFSPDGRYLASGGEDKKIIIWGREPGPAGTAPPEPQGGVSMGVELGGAGTRGSVWLDRSVFAPGEAITVHFTAGEGFAPDAWVGIIPSEVEHGSEAENDRHDISYQYLSGRTSGELSFTAPGKTGSYDMRMNDSDGGGSEVAFTTFTVARPGGAEPAGTEPAQERLQRPAQTGSPDYVSHYFDTEPDHVLVYIYSLNYKGVVRLNGKEFYSIKGERDMNYNSTSGAKLDYGINVFELEYDSLPDAWTSEAKIKVYTYDFESGESDTIAEWIVSDLSGSREFTLDATW